MGETHLFPHQNCRCGYTMIYIRVYRKPRTDPQNRGLALVDIPALQMPLSLGVLIKSEHFMSVMMIYNVMDIIHGGLPKRNGGLMGI
jgi:hypothetical protein